MKILEFFGGKVPSYLRITEFDPVTQRIAYYATSDVGEFEGSITPVELMYFITKMASMPRYEYITGLRWTVEMDRNMLLFLGWAMKNDWVARGAIDLVNEISDAFKREYS